MLGGSPSWRTPHPPRRATTLPTCPIPGATAPTPRVAPTPAVPPGQAEAVCFVLSWLRFQRPFISSDKRSGEAVRPPSSTRLASTETGLILCEEDKEKAGRVAEPRGLLCPVVPLAIWASNGLPEPSAHPHLMWKCLLLSTHFMASKYRCCSKHHIQRPGQHTFYFHAGWAASWWFHCLPGLKTVPVLVQSPGRMEGAGGGHGQMGTSCPWQDHCFLQ